MDHPQHEIAMARSLAGTNRMMGLAFVGLLHVVLIYALLNGLVPNITKIIPGPIDLVPVKPKVAPQPPPPTHGVFKQPTTVGLLPPIIDIDDGHPGRPTEPTKHAGDQTGGPLSVDTPASAIGYTHTIPPYPALASRLGQHGTVRLLLTVSTDGRVTDAEVERSSGSNVLDQAAVEWVMAHWRYHPFLHNGTPTATTVQAAVVFDLRNG